MRNTFYNDFDHAPREPSPPRGVAGDFRTPFQIDRDRVIHTSAFRRLQSKTQVFVSGEYDFYRTRLTHSIEVAQIGRSLCARLRATEAALGEAHFIDPDLVEAACLAHDIGHPPFGHTGERTLHRLMKPWGGFEGNAQTLRMLTHTLFSERKGMNPSRGFMDAVLKYKTLHSELDDPPNHFVYADQRPEIAFVTGGADFPEDLPPGKARNAFRSIECQIMDWADDTAYSLNDVADGIKAGFIGLETLERWAAGAGLSDTDAVAVEFLLKAIRDDRVEGRLNRKIGEFIAAARLADAGENFLAPLSNRHRYRLEIDPAIAAQRDLHKRLSLDLVFRSQQLQQLDHKADYIVGRLFGAFADLYIARDRPGPGHFQLLPEDQEREVFAQDSEAARARLVCDAIARMTDSVAARVYRRLFDANFGSIVDLV
ncbi:MAG: dNTP triphosphohydrolase [Verrucomicrobiae bacterium]|nr:dNTP triphosphohydrolase [Verrucomicrobiae bacterium]MCP5538636.1 dNTP triphosphohydrolase [Akkermansiaceae bacterium]MCP5550901.1 dNTP triphosphohydrolase [Akkermansiaceae bacterium]